MWCGVWGFRFVVWGLGSGVWGLGSGAWGLGCKVSDLGAGIEGGDLEEERGDGAQVLGRQFRKHHLVSER